MGKPVTIHERRRVRQENPDDAERAVATVR